MNLVIDIGNSFVKLAVFEQHRLLTDHYIERNQFLEIIKRIFEVHPKIKQAIIASVGENYQKEFAVVKLFCDVHVLSVNSKLPFIIRYTTPATLGIDRIALMAAAYFLHPRKNVLVIDAGTCITYDVLTENNEYLGGAIAPGVHMRYKAMHNQTAALPLLTPNGSSQLVGDSTESSMHSGVINGMLFEIEGVISQYNLYFKDLTVILTGGDAKFFAKKLKNSIFAHPKFLLQGLDYLLDYNK